MQPQPSNVIIDKIENGFILVFRGKAIFHESEGDVVQNLTGVFKILNDEKKAFEDAMKQAEEAQKQAQEAQAKADKESGK